MFFQIPEKPLKPTFTSKGWVFTKNIKNLYLKQLEAKL